MAYFNGRDILLAGLKGEKGDKGDKGEKGDPGDLGDCVVQTTGESETAVMSQKAVTDAVNDITETQYVDMVDYAEESETGWVWGYYNTADMSITTTDTFMRTEKPIPVNGFSKVTVTPPKGYAVALAVLNRDRTITNYGQANSTKHPENIDVSFVADLTNAVYFGVSVGRFADADADVYAADSVFCNSVKILLEKERASTVEKGQKAHETLYVEKYDWSKIASDTYPTGWKAGVYRAETGEYTDSDTFIVTSVKIPVDSRMRQIRVTPPSGYSTAIFCYKSDGTFDMYGQANQKTYPHFTDYSPIVDIEEYTAINVAVGYFYGASSQFVADKDFIDSIVMTVGYDSDKIDRREIADYFEAEAVETVESVRNLLTEPCLVFPLITDIHYKSLTERPTIFDNSIENMKRVVSEIPCDFVLNLGDNTDGKAELNTTIERGHYITNRFRELDLPYFCAIGNHDTNWYVETLDLSQKYRAYISGTKDAVFNKTNLGTDCYKDFDNLGIRLVVVNANHDDRYYFSPNTVSWLRDTALDTDNIVLFAVHFSSIPSQNHKNRDPAYRTEITAVLQNFINGGGTIIQVCGHSHADYAFTAPWLTVFSTCGKFESVDVTADGFTCITGYEGELVSPERVEGTATEDSWSVVVVRPQARKINFVRFGAGEDREFTF